MSSRKRASAASPADDTLDGFAAFCSLLSVEDGSPFALHPFQRKMLVDYFDGTTETLILLPKKNGKSTLLAALALHHLMVTTDAECVIAAASRDQAQILLGQVQGFIRRSEGLEKRLRVKQREVLKRTGGGRIRVLAADADTADGIIGTLCLVDELHRHRSADLYGVFRDGLGPRNGRMVTISTAGDDLESPLGQLRTKAYAQPGMVSLKAHHYVKAPGFVMHEWALEPDDDRDDLKLVKTANPAPWQTVTALRERHDSPSMTPWQWARFACGVWMAGEDSAISDKEWRACAVEGVEIPKGSKGVYVGIDLGWKWDTSAIVPVWREDGTDIFRVHKPAIITPPGDGTATDEEDIWEPIAAFAARWPDVTFVLDPNAGGEQLAQRIDRELPGTRVVTHSQMATPMALAAQRLSETISAEKLEHPDDPAFNTQVLSATARSVGEGFRFVKQRKKKLPIDAVIALAMAVSTLIGNDGKKPYGGARW